jgi:hypothetical protein
MRSRLLAILSALSLVIGLALMAAWARGYLAYDCLNLQRGRTYCLASCRGTLVMLVCSRYTVPVGGQPPFPAAQRWPRYSDRWEFTLIAETPA